MDKRTVDSYKRRAKVPQADSKSTARQIEASPRSAKATTGLSNVNSPSDAAVGAQDPSATKLKLNRMKMEMYIKWINSLNIGPPLSMRTFADEFKNGLLLCSLIERLQPDIRFTGLNRKPLSKKPALSNLEKALSVVWNKRAKAANIPSAEEIYEGRQDRLFALIAQIFDSFVLQPIRAHIRDVLSWYHDVLTRYGRGLSPASLTSPFSTLWGDFSNGVSLCCVLHYFSGNTDRPSMTRIFWEPETTDELHINISYLFALLSARRVHLFWTPDQFLNQPDLDFLLFQLFIIYKELKDRPVTREDLSSLIFRDDARLRGIFSVPVSPTILRRAMVLDTFDKALVDIAMDGIQTSPFPSSSNFNSLASPPVEDPFYVPSSSMLERKSRSSSSDRYLASNGSQIARESPPRGSSQPVDRDELAMPDRALNAESKSLAYERLERIASEREEEEERRRALKWAQIKSELENEKRQRLISMTQRRAEQQLLTTTTADEIKLARNKIAEIRSKSNSGQKFQGPPTVTALTDRERLTQSLLSTDTTVSHVRSDWSEQVPIEIERPQPSSIQSRDQVRDRDGRGQFDRVDRTIDFDAMTPPALKQISPIPFKTVSQQRNPPPSNGFAGSLHDLYKKEHSENLQDFDFDSYRAKPSLASSSAPISLPLEPVLPAPTGIRDTILDPAAGSSVSSTANSSGVPLSQVSIPSEALKRLRMLEAVTQQQERRLMYEEDMRRRTQIAQEGGIPPLYTPFLRLSPTESNQTVSTASLPTTITTTTVIDRPAAGMAPLASTAGSASVTASTALLLSSSAPSSTFNSSGSVAGSSMAVTTHAAASTQMSSGLSLPLRVPGSVPAAAADPTAAVVSSSSVSAANMATASSSAYSSVTCSPSFSLPDRTVDTRSRNVHVPVPVPFSDSVSFRRLNELVTKAKLQMQRDGIPLPDAFDPSNNPLLMRNASLSIDDRSSLGSVDTVDNGPAIPLVGSRHPYRQDILSRFEDRQPSTNRLLERQ